MRFVKESNSVSPLKFLLCRSKIRSKNLIFKISILHDPVVGHLLTIFWGILYILVLTELWKPHQLPFAKIYWLLNVYLKCVCYLSNDKLFNYLPHLKCENKHPNLGPVFSHLPLWKWKKNQLLMHIINICWLKKLYIFLKFSSLCYTFILCHAKWKSVDIIQPTPVFLPGKSHGQRNLVGYSPWGCKESDTT